MRTSPERLNMPDVGVTVIGAGVVGLAVAARLSRDEPALVVLERRDAYGREASSRNSEVVHAGLYYAPGSLKAQLCVEGNRTLDQIARQHGVAQRRLGKLVVAAETTEEEKLDALCQRARENGVTIERLTAEDARRLEPNVRCVAALHSPTSGIISAHELMDHFARTARSRGAILKLRAEVIELARETGGYRITFRSGPEVETFSSERVVNAAGLESDTIAALAGIDVAAAGYRLHYCKGSYFSVRPAKARLVSRLVYPLPTHVSLGVHAVLGLDGRLRFGPDVEYLADRRLDYAVDEGRRRAFGDAVRRLLPDVEDADLAPDISGIRAKLQGPVDPPRDFVIAEETARGLPGLVNLVGIDSPGLTSSPAIAERVARLLD